MTTPEKPGNELMYPYLAGHLMATLEQHGQITPETWNKSIASTKNFLKDQKS